MDRLFTYGSLQPGGQNERVLGSIEGEWQAAAVRGFLVDTGWGAALGYPAIRLDDDGDIVRGLVLTSTELGDHWERLDEFEGSEDRRVITDVTLDDGRLVPAHVYVIA